MASILRTEKLDVGSVVFAPPELQSTVKLKGGGGGVGGGAGVAAGGLDPPTQVESFLISTPLPRQQP